MPACTCSNTSGSTIGSRIPFTTVHFSRGLTRVSPFLWRP